MGTQAGALDALTCLTCLTCSRFFFSYKMIQAKSADVCGPKSPVISVARNQKLNENESKEPQETTYVSAGDMLTAPWPCQVSTAPSTPRASSTRAVALAFHGQLPTPSSTLCHTVPHGATLPDRTWHLLHQLPCAQKHASNRQKVDCKLAVQVQLPRR